MGLLKKLIGKQKKTMKAAKKTSSTKEKPSKPKAKAAPTPAATPTVVASPARLGTKRACPKCSTKFYDFEKEDLSCPKCSAKFKASDLVSAPLLPPSQPKKPKNVEKTTQEGLMQGEELVATDADAFESLEDLADEENDIEITVDEKEEDY